MIELISGTDCLLSSMLIMLLESCGHVFRAVIYSISSSIFALNY